MVKTMTNYKIQVNVKSFFKNLNTFLERVTNGETSVDNNGCFYWLNTLKANDVYEEKIIFTNKHYNADVKLICITENIHFNFITKRNFLIEFFVSELTEFIGEKDIIEEEDYEKFIEFILF